VIAAGVLILLAVISALLAWTGRVDQDDFDGQRSGSIVLQVPQPVPGDPNGAG
jgi:hypothetical protein